MATLETLHRDVALRVFRFALLPGGHASLEVPQLPRPEVHVARRDAPQVPFDPVPAGVTAGLDAVKAAAHIATASKALRDVVMDDALWKKPLAALKRVFRLGDDPLNPSHGFYGSALQKEKYRDPRHEESNDDRSVFTQYRALLRFVEMTCEDFYESCHHNVRGLAQTVGMGPMSQYWWEEEVPAEFRGYLVRGDEPPPYDWYETVFTDATIGRMVWNSFSRGLMRGLFLDDWDILIGGANAFEYETGKRERFMCDLVPEELVARGYMRGKTRE